MKKIFVVFVLLFMMSCNRKPQDASEQYFDGIKSEITDKFGVNSYFAGLTVTESAQGTVISVLHCSNPQNLETNCYVYANGVWKEMYKQPLKALPNIKPENFLFKLDEKIDSYSLSKVVKSAQKDIRDRIHVNDLKLYQLAVRPPKSGNVSSMHYQVTIKSDSLQRDFYYRYNIDGTLYDAELNNTE